MLVLELSKGDRVRINGATDLVITEIHDGQVEIAIDRSTDSADDPEV